jgi:hypothetical protein
VAFKTKTSNDGDANNTSTEDDVALMVKRFKKFMKQKVYQGGSSKGGKTYGKNSFAKKKCFECGEMSHISTNYKNKDEENSRKKKRFEGKKKLFKKYNKKKNGMLSGIRLQAQILTPMMMSVMRNSPRRVLPVLSSRRHHLFLTHFIVSYKYVICLNASKNHTLFAK